MDPAPHRTHDRARIAPQDHCPSAGAVGAASPGTCTYIDPNALKLNADLPGYVTNGVQEVGAIASINQDRCYNDDGSNVADCCVKQSIKNKVTGAIEEVSVCASWSGSHLSSQGCIQVRRATLGVTRAIADSHVRHSTASWRRRRPSTCRLRAVLSVRLNY
jgi:hypothetical protein